MKEVIKKALSNEYLAFVLLLKDFIELIRDAVTWIKLPEPKPQITMDYFEIILHVFIALWLFYMIKQFKAINADLQINKVVTKYLQYRITYRGHLQSTIPDDVLLKQYFTEGELTILNAYGYIKTSHSST